MYNIVYYNAQQLSNSSVVASVTGVISVAAPACTISGTLASGPQTQTVTQTSAISDVTGVYPK